MVSADVFPVATFLSYDQRYDDALRDPKEVESLASWTWYSFLNYWTSRPSAVRVNSPVRAGPGGDAMEYRDLCCRNCSFKLYGEVAYCPFCGWNQALSAPNADKPYTRARKQERPAPPLDRRPPPASPPTFRPPAFKPKPPSPAAGKAEKDLPEAPGSAMAGPGAAAPAKPSWWSCQKSPEPIAQRTGRPPRWKPPHTPDGGSSNS